MHSVLITYPWLPESHFIFLCLLSVLVSSLFPDNIGVNEIRSGEGVFLLMISEVLITLPHCFGFRALLHHGKSVMERVLFTSSCLGNKETDGKGPGS